MKQEDVKLGMKVKIVREGFGCGYDCVGEVHTILGFSEQGGCNGRINYTLSGLGGRNIWSEAFIPADAYDFEIGCVVRVKRGIDTPNGIANRGKEGVVVEIDGQYITVSGLKDGFPRSHLTVIKPAEPSPKFHVGQRVRCVNNENTYSTLDLEKIYVVRAFDIDGDLYLEDEFGVKFAWRFVPADPEPVVVHGTMFSQAAVDEAFSKAIKRANEGTKPSRDGAASICSSLDINMFTMKSIEQFANNIVRMNVGVDNMETENYKTLAERMKDEYVGAGRNTVFLKKAGEHNIERRTVSVTITVDDIETLLKAKGIAKSLGVCEIETYPTEIGVGIIKFTPVKTQ